MTKVPVCAFRVARDSYVCMAGVRTKVWTGRLKCDIRGHVWYRVPPCGQELVRGEIRIFRYEIRGTGIHRSTPVWGPILHFPHACSDISNFLGTRPKYGLLKPVAYPAQRTRRSAYTLKYRLIIYGPSSPDA